MLKEIMPLTTLVDQIQQVNLPLFQLLTLQLIDTLARGKIMVYHLGRIPSDVFSGLNGLEKTPVV